jgi:hypothetical protein
MEVGIAVLAHHGGTATLAVAYDAVNATGKQVHVRR